MKQEKLQMTILKLPQSLLRKSHPIILIAAIASIIIGITLPIADKLIELSKYQIHPSVASVIGHTNQNLSNKLTYDDDKKAYIFNQAGLSAQTETIRTPQNPQDIVKKMQAQTGGNGSKDKSLYSASLASDPKLGVKYYDNNLGLSFSLIPQFPLLPSKKVSGKILYPSKENISAIYTPKSNGLKEDIILNNPTSDEVSFTYKLSLPEELSPRILPDGSLGIYSADPSLFGNISFGSGSDQETIMKARKVSTKSNLVFNIPAPVIKTSNQKHKHKAIAHFNLTGNTLSVKVISLASITAADFPISIDPSVIISSSSEFDTGNYDGGIDATTAGQITRGSLTGGSIATWGTVTPTTVFSIRNTPSSCVYNNFVYLLGGYDGTTIFNDTYYAAVGSGGTIGNFVTGTIMNSRRTQFSVQCYNGYIYAIGGSVTGATNSTPTVEFAKLDPTTGAIGNWAFVNSFTNGRYGHASAIINNYMYISTGYTGTTYLADTQYVPINADGTLGTWLATTSLGSVFSSATGASSGSVFYITGGTNGATGIQTVSYATQKSDGTLGAWSTSSNFTTQRTFPVITINNGYFYIVGGFNGGSGSLADVQYAQVNTDGSLGAWSATTSLPATRTDSTGFTYKGYIYVLGGKTGAVYLNSILSTKIDPPGVTTPFSAATAPATARAFASSVAYNGYLYILGGCTAISGDTCTTPSTLVSFAKIGVNGVLGAWANTANALTAARAMGSAVAYEGRLYYISGRPTSTTLATTVYHTAISPTTGNTTAAWTAVAAPTGLTARYGQSSVIYNGNLFVIGGCTTASGVCAAYLNDVQQAVLATAGGFAANPNCANNFCPLSTFTTARWGHGSALFGNILYVSGGVGAGGNLADIQYASVSSTGTLNAFATTTSITNARYAHIFGQSNGYLYVNGGKTTTAATLSDTMYARLLSTGAIATDSGCGSSWCTTQSLTVATAGAAGAVYDGYVYSATGQTNGTTAVVNVYTASVNNGGTGMTAGWTANASTFTNGRSGLTSLVYNGFLYMLGGQGIGAVYYNDVQYAPITINGSLGTFATANPYTTNRTSFGAIAYNGYLYVYGGDNNGTYLNDVQYALICTGSNNGVSGCSATAGSLGTWKYTFNSASSGALVGGFTTGRGYFGYGLFKNFIYIVGGGGVPGRLADSQYAPINADGTIGTWVATTSMPSPAGGRNAGQVLIYNGYMYLLGGNSAGGRLNDVLYVLICTGLNNGIGGCSSTAGAIGTWNSTTSFSVIRSGLRIYAYNGYMYIVSGFDGTAGMADVQFAPFKPDGTVGNWQASQPLPAALQEPGVTQYNGNLYVVGGNNGGTVLNTVQYSQLASIPRVGYYSRIFSFGSPAALQSITVNGSTANNDNPISYKLSGSNAIWGAAKSYSSFSNGPVGTSICDGFGSGNTSYVEAILKIDDTSIASFPEATANNLSFITDLTVNFSRNAGHPAPNTRLYLGKQFVSELIQPLDTCKI